MRHYLYRLERKAMGINYSRSEWHDVVDLTRDAAKVGLDTAGYPTRDAAEQAARQIDAVSASLYAIRIVRY